MTSSSTATKNDAVAYVEDASDTGSESGSGADSNNNNNNNNNNITVYKKNDRKVRAKLLKAGWKPIPLIERVYIKRTGNLHFAVNDPEVLKDSDRDCYVVFGEMKVEEVTTTEH